ncbi:MAG: DNRLRE domain-containing protein [Bacilli bacterium]|nr:DNRLRE domain-containing protein [Bacilli bacterium]
MKEVELKEKRGKRFKQFLRQDGTITAKIFCDDIHYKKNGKFVEIDNTLIEENKCYTNKSNDYKVLFPKHVKDTFMRMEKDNNFVEIDLDSCNKVKCEILNNKSVLNSCLIYKDIFDGIDFKYEINPNKVKETIIINDKKFIKDNFSFFVKTNLSLELINNEILAKENENTIFKFEIPFMHDSNGNKNTNVTYNLKKCVNGYDLILKLDSEWLDSTNVIFPIYIDPTIANTTSGGSVYDTYVSSNAINSNKGAEEILKAGVERIDGVDVKHRTLLKFDLPDIGTGDEIISANLALYSYPSYESVSDGEFVAIHRVTEEWNENVVTWASIDGKYDALIEALYDGTRSTVDSDNVIQFPESRVNSDITNLVKKWYTDTPNYGILLKTVNEEYKGDSFPAFFSKKNNTISGGGSEIQPALLITYKNYNGLEDYLDYMEEEFTLGSTYINTFNGNLTGVFNLGATINGKFPISVDLIYNTNDVILNKQTVYGKGYKLSFDQTIKELVLNDFSYLEYLDNDGTSHYFYKKENSENTNRYFDEDGLDLYIDKEESKYVLTDKNNSKMYFENKNNVYYLMEIIDADNDKVEIIRNDNNEITKLIDANNAEINFTYNDSQIVIQSPDSSVTLNYVNNTLSSIISLEGTTVIEYNDNFLISRIIDVNGMSIVYEYFNSPFKVKKITNYGKNNILGAFYNFHYGFHTTTIVDDLGVKKSLIFNSNGNVISTNTLHDDEDLNNAYSLVETYDETEDKKNKTKSQSVPIKYVKNLLKNSSFETDDDIFTASETIIKSFSTEAALSGSRSLKLVSGNDSYQNIFYNITIEKGKYYTFSGNFKNDASIKLELEYLDKDSNRVFVTENVGINDNFSREDITIYYPADATSTLILSIYFDSAGGTTYIDDIQLEEGEVVNEYNFLENSDFSLGILDWDKTVREISSNNLISTDDYFEVVKFNNNKNNALKINMSPLYENTLKKKFLINGKKGDLYRISFWYKNEGIFSDGINITNSILINFTPNDIEESVQTINPKNNFNQNANIWQYMSCDFVSPYDYSEIELCFSQLRNANSLYITNISMYKDVAGNYFEYDSNGNIKSIRDTLDNYGTFDYDQNRQLVKGTDNNGNNYKIEYDNLKKDRPLSIISSKGISNKTKYDSNGNSVGTRIIKTGNSELVSGNYKIRSKGTNDFLALKSNRKLSFKANSCSNPIWYIDVVGVNILKIYFANMNNYSIGCLGNTSFLTTVDDNNMFIFEENNNGSFKLRCLYSEKYLLNNNNMLEASDYINNDSRFEFYFELVEEEFLETSSAYSIDGRFITSTSDYNNKKTSYTYDETTGLMTSIIDANGIETNYYYNDKQQLTKITTGDREIIYEYNADNAMNKVINGNKIYNYDYDDFLNRKSISIGNDITLANYNYYPNNGELSSIKYGNNQEVFYEYDEFNRTNKIIKSDDIFYNKYDNNGNLVKIISDEQTEKYTFDILKRLKAYKCNDFKTKYQYDSHGNVTEVEYMLGDNIEKTVSIYDNNNMLNILNFTGFGFNYKYDSLGRLIKRYNFDSIDDCFVEYDYLRFGKLSTNLIENIKTKNNLLNYKYDKLNNVTHVSNNGVLEHQYYYNNYNELVREDNLLNNTKTEFIYDNYGNILSKKIYNLAYNSIIESNVYSYESTSFVDLLTKFNNESIVYDTIGNPISIGNNISINWVNGSTMKNFVNTAKNLNVSYKYNIDGIRISKNVNNVETKYYLEGGNIIYEQNGDDIIYYLYDFTGVIGLMYNYFRYYFEKNLFGDIVAILDSDFNVVARYEYDAWGNILSIRDNDGNIITDKNHIAYLNPFRYRSYYYDNETDLYYLNKRYYNPKWGRFLNADEYAVNISNVCDTNMFAYVSNNPVSRIDESGEFWDIALDVVSIICSTYEFIKKPTLNNGLYLGADVALAIVPFVPSTGSARTVVKSTKAADKAKDISTSTKTVKTVKAVSTAKKTNTTKKAAKQVAKWTPGDPVDMLTIQGNYPSWSTVRKSYWINESINYKDYGDPVRQLNLSRMQQGKPPLVKYKRNGKFYPMEIHHKEGRYIPNPHNISNLEALSPWKHAEEDIFRHFKP